MLKKYNSIHTICFFIVLFSLCINGQNNYTKQDTIFGSITPERVWWDVKKYDLNVEVFPDQKKIKGFNTVTYKVIHPHQTLQFDLQHPLVVDSVLQNNFKLLNHNFGKSHYVFLKKEQEKSSINKITIYYHGTPKTAKRAPWDGGFVWSKDQNFNHFIATANQSVGASIWWPCKDHPSDEPNEININITSPSNLIGVSNGKLIKQQQNNNKTTTYHWQVKNPINPYGVCLNIADYVHEKNNYNGLNGKLKCNYYYLKQNEAYSKIQFKDVFKSLKAFEYWFGPYPFYKDGYKLVDVPYLGMEHQSCIGYGNQYKKGYLGKGLGNSSWGMKFDYIIVHETSHEWFANSITCNDVADLWVHEAFATYAESLFLEYYYGKKAAHEYLMGLKPYVLNNKPIIGNYSVKQHGSNDMYFKGALVLNTLRQIVNDDLKWRKILLGINKQFYHKTISGQQIINYIDNQIPETNLIPFFKQYLNTTKIPKLLVEQKGTYIYYKWENTVADFNIPIKITLNNIFYWITPDKNKWQKIYSESNTLKIDSNFYVKI